MWTYVRGYSSPYKQGVIVCIRTYKSNHWSLVKYDNQMSFHFFYLFSHDDQKMERDKQYLEIALSMPKTIVDQMTPSISACSVCFPHISVSLLLLRYAKAGEPVRVIALHVNFFLMQFGIHFWLQFVYYWNIVGQLIKKFHSTFNSGFQ